ncbi:MAG: hypothetical protein AVO33_09795 [delta proteobacterium ML8_F1]|nr:MAG: hypothetical protein AVO33_09795 [delta proteobacterium ML8_F1]
MKINNEDVVANVKEKTMKLIDENGIKGFNMADLAKESGLAKDTLYRLIGSKEKWLMDVLISKVTNNKRAIVAIINSDDIYITKLEKIIHEVSNFMFELSSENIKEVLEAYPAISEELFDLKSNLDDVIIAFIKSGISNGFFVEDLEAHFLLEIVNANIFYFFKTDSSNQVRENISKSLNYLLKGVQNG